MSDKYSSSSSSSSRLSKAKIPLNNVEQSSTTNDSVLNLYETGQKERIEEIADDEDGDLLLLRRRLEPPLSDDNTV